MQDSRFERTAEMIWIDSLRTGMWSNLLKKHTDFLLLYMIQRHEYTRRNSQFVSSRQLHRIYRIGTTKKATDHIDPKPLLITVYILNLTFWTNNQCREKRKDNRRRYPCRGEVENTGNHANPSLFFQFS